MSHDPYQPWLSPQRDRDPFKPWVTKQARDLEAWRGGKAVAMLLAVLVLFCAMAYNAQVEQEMFEVGYVQANADAPVLVKARGGPAWVSEAQARRSHRASYVLMGGFAVFVGTIGALGVLRLRAERRRSAVE